MELLDGYLTDETLLDEAGCGALEDIRCLSLVVDTAETVVGDLGRRMPHLTQLKLNGSTIPALRDLGTSLAHLTVLWVNRCGVGSLAGIGALHSLEELYAAFNYVADLSPVCALARLGTLDLEGNQLATLADIQLLGQCPSLVSASLEGNPVAEDPGYAAAVAAGVPQLKWLDDEDVCRAEQPAAAASSAAAEGGAGAGAGAEPLMVQEWPQCTRAGGGGDDRLRGLIATMEREICSREVEETRGATESALRQRERSLVQEAIRRSTYVVSGAELSAGGGGGGGGGSRPASAAAGRRPGTGYSSFSASRAPGSRPSTAAAAARYQRTPFGGGGGGGSGGGGGLLSGGGGGGGGVGGGGVESVEPSVLTHNTTEVFCGNPIRRLRAKPYGEPAPASADGGEEGDDGGGDAGGRPGVRLTHASSHLAQSLDLHTEETVLESVIAAKLSQSSVGLTDELFPSAVGGHGGSGGGSTAGDASSMSYGDSLDSSAAATPAESSLGGNGLLLSGFQTCKSLSLRDFTREESVL